MATHFKDYETTEGWWTACGRFFDDGNPMPRGVVVQSSISGISCHNCIGSERFKLARARVKGPLDAATPPTQESER